MTSIFGTTWHKLVRRGDPDTSKAAAQAVDTTRLEQLVYETIHKFGYTGCTQDAVLDELNHLPYSSVTGRFSALIRKGLVEDTGQRLPGRSGRSQRVLRVTTKETDNA